MQITLTSDVAKFTKRLTNIRRQIPFATSKAINATAWDVRTQITQSTYPKSFPDSPSRTSFPAAAFKVKNSNKHHLQASVYDRFETDYLKLHVTGGIKRPKSGRKLAIPTRNVKRTKKGRATASTSPQRLLSDKGFIAKSRGASAIVTPVRKKLRYFYFLHDKARIERRFPFYKDGNRVAGSVYQGHFRRELREAFRTAR